MNIRFGVCALMLMLAYGSVAEAATFCVTSGNQLNQALDAAGFNGQDDTIKVATGTHITDFHAPGAYQWSFEPVVGVDYEGSLTISGGWNAADNCQTQSTLDPAATVLDARYWGPVFVAAMVFEDFTGTLQISNLTFYRGESNDILSDAAMRVISQRGTLTFDNILVTGNRSGANSSRIATISLNASGTLKLRNSQFLNNSFTHSSSGGLSFSTTNGAVGIFTNNSISVNTATISRMGLESFGIVTLSNNAIGDNSSTANPSYDFLSNAPTSLTLNKNHFQTVSISNGAPSSEIDTTTGDPDWTLVGSRMVPDAVSPLRDSGDNSPLGGVPSIDFSGQPRIVNLTIDRGAVEADAPPGVAIGPLVTAVSPADGSTTVLIHDNGQGAFTQLTFNVSGGTAPGVTKLECSVTSGAPNFGIGSSGETVAVGGSITPIDVGFTYTGAQQTGVVSCEITRDFAGTSFVTYNFTGVPEELAGPAIFDSSPKKSPDPASTIELTPALAAIVGTDVLPKSLKLFNVADFGDSDMQVFCGPSGGSNPQITITPPVFNGDLISPQGVLEVTFDCDTSTAGSFFANYGCSYDLDESTNPATTDGTAQYRVECDVRNPPKTEVETTPSSGTQTTKVVGPGGSANFDFSFEEVSPDPDPPDDAFLLNCFIDGTDQGRFSIDSPGFPGGPYPIVKLAPQTVQVTGTDDGSKDIYTANLNCEYSESENPSISAIFPLVLQVRGDARFRVSKEFTDGDNPTEVEVTISCNTGLPIIQSQEISETQDVTFIVQSFDPGEMDCTITEDTGAPELNGYTPTYTAGGPGDWDDGSGGCVFTEIDASDEFTCAIVNDADPVPVEIEKLWVIEGDGGDAVDQHYKLTLYCNAEIDGSDEYCHGDLGGYGENPVAENGGYESCKQFEGYTSASFTAWVTPEWPNSHCWVDETVYDDSVKIDNGCLDLTVSHGDGDSCLIINTVFFEGIPILNQYGMALLALLMLGVGLVGFRRMM
ncbi:MAG TPA: IPTL-CTERM sorting domain-containing protein [Xanthomonadales bacterium]|nr:IPTL-CTERM sorting domain-containing protein [Xanthomonadales bacterium]